MKEVDDALLKLQIALDNDSEVSIARIENIESVYDRIAKNYAGMLNMTDQIEQNADLYDESKNQLQALLKKLNNMDEVVSRYEKLAHEIDEWTKDIDANSRSVRP